MCTDDNIDQAFFQSVKRFFLLFFGTEAAEQTNINRLILEPFPDRLIVLLAQYGCRDQYSDLFYIVHCFKSRKYSDLCLSVAYNDTSSPDIETLLLHHDISFHNS